MTMPKGPELQFKKYNISKREIYESPNNKHLGEICCIKLNCPRSSPNLKLFDIERIFGTTAVHLNNFIWSLALLTLSQFRDEMQRRNMLFPTFSLILPSYLYTTRWLSTRLLLTRTFISIYTLSYVIRCF